MRTILDLYPRAWRDRYRDELEALLEMHPATLLDRVDLIRGAIDARLHPQVPGSARSGRENSVNVRLLGAVAAIGGTAWILAIASMVILPRDAEGYRDASLAIIGFAVGLGLTGVALGELGSRRESASSARTGHVIAVVSLALAVLGVMPWPIFVIPLFTYPLLAFAAAVRATTNGTMPGWLSMLFGFAAVASIAGFLGSFDGDPALVLIGSTGLAALALAWVAVSGRAPTTSEASPA